MFLINVNSSSVYGLHNRRKYNVLSYCSWIRRLHRLHFFWPSMVQRLILYLGVSSVVAIGTKLIWWLLDSELDQLSEDGLHLASDQILKKPGRVSLFSLSLMFLESISTTWPIRGLRTAAAWVQKKATLMNFITSCSGNSPSSGSTSSISFLSS